MPSNPVSIGDVALIRIGELRAPVVIRQVNAKCAACGHDPVLMEVLDTGERYLLPRVALVGLCDTAGCYDGCGRCVHCGRGDDGEHLPGCPHDMVDECDAHPAELEEGAETGAPPYTTVDGVPVIEGLKVFTCDAKWGTVTQVAVWPADQDPTDAWHQVTHDDGSVGRYNRERLSTREPRGW